MLSHQNHGTVSYDASQAQLNTGILVEQTSRLGGIRFSRQKSCFTVQHIQHYYLRQALHCERLFALVMHDLLRFTAHVMRGSPIVARIKASTVVTSTRRDECNLTEAIIACMEESFVCPVCAFEPALTKFNEGALAVFLNIIDIDRHCLRTVGSTVILTSQSTMRCSGPSLLSQF